MLDVPVSFFFDDMPDNLTRTQDGSRRAVVAENQEGSSSDDRVSQRETLELVRAYYRIRDPSTRQRILELIRSMGPPE